MTGNPRIHTLLTPEQYLKLTALCIRDDRSEAYVVSRAIERHLNTVTEPYQGDATIKLQFRTTPENVAAVKDRGGVAWRWINACVQEMLGDG